MSDRFWAIIPSGGAGTRSGATLPKQYVEIQGEPILLHTARAIASHPLCLGVSVATHPEWGEQARAMLQVLERPVIVVNGGDRRQDSVYAALRATPADCDLLLVHDAARPLLSHDLINRVLAGLQRADAAIPGVPVVDTLKRVDDEGMVRETVDRSLFRAVQTPQGAGREVLLGAFEAAIAENLAVTDEAMLVESAGGNVVVVEGDPENIKVTHPEDFARVASILSARE